METGLILIRFLENAVEDPRIGPSHISLFLAILHLFEQQRCQSPVSLYSHELMRQAKISNRTYHSCLAYLKEAGYLKYVPSFDPAKGSLFYIVMPGESG